MTAIFTRLTVLCLLLGLSASPAAAKRVALVIGNDDYATLDNLNNARKDARDMAAKLADLDFEVILKLNAGEREIVRALADFKNRLAGGEAGLVFYAGHGVEADGRNWLIPSDAKVESEDDLASEAIDAADFLTSMGQAGAPVNIVILDACRNNPLPKRTRSAERGLSVTAIPAVQGQGIAMMFAAGPGEAAADGPTGGNGVFTGALLEALDHPGLKVEDVFKQTARAVNQSTGGKQTPWINTSLTGDFYFRPGGGGGGSQTPSDPDTVFWQTIQGSGNVEDFQFYLRQFPNGAYAALAKRRIEALVPPPPPLPAGTVFRDCWDTVVVSGDALPSGVFCGPEMVLVPLGSFRMGSTDNKANDDEQPPHQVSIDYSLAVGIYEVTQSEWQSLMGSNPSYFKGGDRPVERVSWEDAREFIAKLNERTGHDYRLLTEAEWEYVARAGTTTAFSTGKDRISTDEANFDGNYTYNGSLKGEYRGQTTSVGTFKPNGFGLYDVHGNVWEWVSDCYDEDAYETHQSYPEMVGTWHDSCSRVVRGGSWGGYPKSLRSAIRFRSSPSNRYDDFGFRVARTVFGP